MSEDAHELYAGIHLGDLFIYLLFIWGRSLLRHCAARREVAGSTLPVGSLEVFRLRIPSGRSQYSWGQLSPYKK